MIHKVFLFFYVLSACFLLNHNKIHAQEKSGRTGVSDATLVLEDIVHTNSVYLFTHNDKQSLDYKFYNPSKENFHAKYSLTIYDHRGTQFKNFSGEFILNASTRSTQNMVTNTSSWPYGVYYALLVLNDKSTSTKVIERKTWFGVTSATVLGKATDNEFLYGMDVCLGHFYDNKYLLKWMDFTGTDIIRLGVWDDGEDEFEKYYPIYKNQNLKVSVVYDPPKDLDSATRMFKLKQKCNSLENIARKHPEIKYYELGNEPDLKGFYPGPMEEYTYSFEQMYKAIKKGNPNTVVMNGGLCFFGEEGNFRANKFVELVDTQFIDAFAYHAHGYGSEAERLGYDNMFGAMNKWNKGNKQIFDTESGTPTVTMEQEKMQAATVLQKQVYAQSKGLGYLMWFRFLMFEEPYGNLYSMREPRPVVIAYRNMVETLRGYKFCEIIDLRKKGAESYLFKEINGNGRIVVAWVNAPMAYTIKLKLAEDNNQLLKPEIIDLFGNSQIIDNVVGGSANININENPVFIRWDTQSPDFKIKRAVSAIDIKSELPLGINVGNTIEFTVNNTENRKIDAEISFKANTSIPVLFASDIIHVTLNPNESKNLKVSVTPKPPVQNIQWPDEWTIYTGIASPDPGKMKAIPEFIKVNDSIIYGNKVRMDDHIVDFAQIGVSNKEKSPAVAFAEIISEADTTLTVGSAADWWMEWYINGEPVYNTLEKGNEGPMFILDHTFKIKLVKGKNIIAVKVLSGLGGWKFTFGNPLQIERAKNKTLDNIEISFLKNNKVIETEKSLVRFVSPIPQINKTFNGKNITKWKRQPPTAFIKDKGVFNFFDKFPDNSKWWKGEKDLSAVMWIYQGKGSLKIAVKVTDDVYTVPKNVNGLIQNDAVLFAFANSDTKKVTQYLISSIKKNAFVGKYTGTYPDGTILPVNDIKARIVNVDGAVWYEAEIPKKLIAGNNWYFNLLINDGDWGQRKQYMEWLPGLGQNQDIELWYKLVL